MKARMVKGIPGVSSMYELVHKYLRGRARCGIDAEYVLKRSRHRRRLGVDHAPHRIDDRGKGNASRQKGGDRHLVRGVELRRAGAALGYRGRAERARGEALFVGGPGSGRVGKEC